MHTSWLYRNWQCVCWTDYLSRLLCHDYFIYELLFTYRVGKLKSKNKTLFFSLASSCIYPWSYCCFTLSDFDRNYFFMEKFVRNRQKCCLKHWKNPSHSCLITLLWNVRQVSAGYIPVTSLQHFTSSLFWYNKWTKLTHIMSRGKYSYFIRFIFLTKQKNKCKHCTIHIAFFNQTDLGQGLIALVTSVHSQVTKRSWTEPCWLWSLRLRQTVVRLAPWLSEPQAN